MGLQDFDITFNTGVEVDRVIEHIRIELTSLNWMTHPYGRAFSFMDETTKKRQPMIYEGLGKNYVNLTPDNDRSGMSWFFIGDGFHDQEEGIITHRIGLVVSANLALIDENRLDTELFTQELMQEVRAVLLNRCIGKGYILKLANETREFKKVFVELLPFEDKDETHFSETRNVHLAPLQQFRINFDVTYFEESCGVVLPPLPSPDECQDVTARVNGTFLETVESGGTVNVEVIDSVTKNPIIGSIVNGKYEITQTGTEAMIKPPQNFNPTAPQVSADSAVFTLSGIGAVVLVSVNGQVIDDAEYSLATDQLTVTPTNGFAATSDEVLVFQYDD